VIGNKNMKIGNVRMEMSHFLSQIGEVSHSLQKAVWFES